MEMCCECGVNPFEVGDHHIWKMPFRDDDGLLYKEGDCLLDLIMSGAIPLEDVTDEQRAIMERDSTIGFKIMCSVCRERFEKTR